MSSCSMDRILSTRIIGTTYSLPAYEQPHVDHARSRKPTRCRTREKTFTNLPSSATAVCVESKIDEAGLPL